MRFGTAVTAIIFLVFCSQLFAATRTDACATYLNTKKSYLVDVTLISGTELNQKTQSYLYDGLSTYAVIFWSQNQVSVIELDFFIGSLNPIGTRGYDQDGRPWDISSNTSLCF